MFGLDFIRKLKPCKWRYKGLLDDGVDHFGFIAQEVDSLASHKDYAFVEIAPDGVYKIHPWEFIGPIVKAIQEIDRRVTRLEENKSNGVSAESSELGKH